MSFSPAQRAKIVEWIAAGMNTKQINELAAKEPDPFEVTRQQVRYYRRTQGLRFEDIKREHDEAAVRIGLADKQVRIERLAKIAELLEPDLMGATNKLWVTSAIETTGRGSKKVIIFEKREFNNAEVGEYRRLLDDIAKELGDRKIISEATDDHEVNVHVTWENK